MVVERIKTGIYGLDELIQGGFPKGRTILISGACGTGKSILGMQFIFRGAAEYGEPGVFVAFDEMPDKLRQDMLNFGWNIKDLEAKHKIAIVDGTSAKAGTPSDEDHAILPGESDIDRILIEIVGVARNIGAKRIVIDSIPSMATHVKDVEEIRKNILKLSYVISRAGMTAVLITDVPEQSFNGNLQFSKYEVEEYVSDGVILLSFLGGGGQGAMRTIYVRKMRGTKHVLELHPLEITDKGLIIKKINEVLR